MRHPALYEINTHVLLSALAARLGRPATLDDVPGAELDRLAAVGFEWLWFLGVWQTGPEGRRISLADPDCLPSYRLALEDFEDRDVCGSCFAISRYEVHQEFGGHAALDRLRERLHRRGLRLMLDFVPNHTARDHHWVVDHPEYYVQGTEADLAREPRNYCRIDTAGGPAVLAHGRDPYFPGWTDTLQLNYAEPCLMEAMASELERVAAMCPGVRCDMAMLILPDVFESTWGLRPEHFWPDAIGRVRAAAPEFVFLAEVYWDLEWTLQRQGFDYTYDKRLYDRLRDGHARPVRDHLRAYPEFQRRSARFLENHDEPRAAAAFSPEMHRAAAVVAFLCPGLRFFHQGQLEGWKKRIPVQLARGPEEVVDGGLRDFYDRLLPCVMDDAAREGEWQLLETRPAWEGNWTWDCFVCLAWEHDGRRLLIAVNYAPNQSQCYVRLPFASGAFHLRDRLSEAAYERSGEELYLDLPAWGFHVFEVVLPAGSG